MIVVVNWPTSPHLAAEPAHCRHGPSTFMFDEPSASGDCHLSGPIAECRENITNASNKGSEILYSEAVDLCIDSLNVSGKNECYFNVCNGPPALTRRRKCVVAFATRLNGKASRTIVQFLKNCSSNPAMAQCAMKFAEACFKNLATLNAPVETCLKQLESACSAVSDEEGEEECEEEVRNSIRPAIVSWCTSKPAECGVRSHQIQVNVCVVLSLFHRRTFMMMFSTRMYQVHQSVNWLLHLCLM